MRAGCRAPRGRAVFACLAAVLAATGCYRVRSELIASPTPPESLYQCVLLELGRAGYAIVDADGAAGWVRAQRRYTTILGAVRHAEIYATVIPADVAGSHLQLSDNSYAREDADLIRARCIE